MIHLSSMAQFMGNHIIPYRLRVNITSRFDGQEKAVHAHDWLDNDGKNAWEVWKVFIQEKNNSVWEATLKVANTVDGEKVLYEIHPIEMVEAARKPDTSTTNDKVAQPDIVVKTEVAEALDIEVDYSRDLGTESTSATRFSHRDTSSVPADIASFVDKALTDRRSDQQLEITIATKWDNSTINKLGRSWIGKYTGAKSVITGEYVRHIINSHGNAFLEALQGQLYMDGDAIKIALSNLRAGKGRVIGGTYSRRGNPTIVTEIPINGYTLYAEEPLEDLRGLEIEGRTIYMKPTSTTALKPTQRAGSIPQRRGGLTLSIDATSRIVNNYLVDTDGKPVEFHGVAI